MNNIKKLESLSELCIQSLVQNKEQFPVIGGVPIRLLYPYLKRINITSSHLLRFEKFNPDWIFDDEDDSLWSGFLKMEFPSNVNDKYVASKDKIIRFYLDTLKTFGIDIHKDETFKDPIQAMMIRNKLKRCIKRDPMSYKYMIPHRMLYLQYQEDLKRKEIQVAANLRLQMEKIKMERDQKSSVTVGEKFYIANTSSFGRKRGKNVVNGIGILPPLTSHSTKRDTNGSPKRPHVERVAFGGMAGRKIDPNAFKIISRDPPLKTTSNPVVNPPEERPTGTTTPVSPRRPLRTQDRHSTGQNIFLNKRHKRIKRPLTSTTNPITPANNTKPQGTKKHRSSIFQSQTTTRATTTNDTARTANTNNTNPNSQQNNGNKPIFTVKKTRSLQNYLKNKQR